MIWRAISERSRRTDRRAAAIEATRRALTALAFLLLAAGVIALILSRVRS